MQLRPWTPTNNYLSSTVDVSSFKGVLESRHPLEGYGGSSASCHCRVHETNMQRLYFRQNQSFSEYHRSLESLDEVSEPDTDEGGMLSDIFGRIRSVVEHPSMNFVSRDRYHREVIFFHLFTMKNLSRSPSRQLWPQGSMLRNRGI